MRTIERATFFVVAVEIGFPLSLLAWRYSLRQISPSFARYLEPVAHLLPLMAVPLAILIWATLTRLRRGLPSWRWAIPVLLLQFAAVAAGECHATTTIPALLFGCTVLVTLRAPWAWPLFGASIAIGVVLDWTPPWLGMLGLLLHNLLVGAVIYTAVRMAELAVSVRRAQGMLAGFAVVQERARVSRDLHDTLGQELTAVGLRAELAAKLMASDPDRAAREIRSVQQMTERTLDDVRRVAHGEWQPIFDDELATGTALLESAGVRCHISASTTLPDRIGRVAGWVLREGITNVLKHSSARNCQVTVDQLDDVFRLTIDNDGLSGRPGEPGGGLLNITERVAALNGCVRSGVTADARFRLVAEIPIGED
ncbi:sensor histidine kinase [Amycolatopsis sp. lyj-108]|uniref:sensor histidine kinase n=1 Tax=Amycolatopsis sp. lyj-108 TaxID=2789286 RepID=UPI00397D3F2E